VGRGAALPALLGRVLDVLMSCASGSAKMGRNGAAAPDMTSSFPYEDRGLDWQGRELWAFKINWQAIGRQKSEQQTVGMVRNCK
jgi:hypothetical protein